MDGDRRVLGRGGPRLSSGRVAVLLAVAALLIEDAGQARELRRLGCPAGQGFHFSRPVPAGEFAALLDRGAFALAEA